MLRVPHPRETPPFRSPGPWMGLPGSGAAHARPCPACAETSLHVLLLRTAGPPLCTTCHRMWSRPRPMQSTTALRRCNMACHRTRIPHKRNTEQYRLLQEAMGKESEMVHKSSQEAMGKVPEQVVWAPASTSWRMQRASLHRSPRDPCRACLRNSRIFLWTQSTMRRRRCRRRSHR